MKSLFLVSLLSLLLGAACAQAQDVCIYMTIHNLGCRQSNHAYTGFTPNNGFDEGDLVQVILSGPNGHIDPPLTDGSPGGDDQLAANPGLPFAMNPASFTQAANTFYSPNAILIQNPGNGPEPALHVGSKFYVRAWNGASPYTSTRYYNSAQLWQDYPIGTDPCNMDSSSRTIRANIIVPTLITYAVNFDTGHDWTAGPNPPLVVVFCDSIHITLYWHPVMTATSYRIEWSNNNSTWTTFATTSDTLYSLPDEPGNITRLYRVYAAE